MTVGGSRTAGGRVEAIAAVDRALIIDGIGLFASRQGDYEEARARAEAAAAIWSALGDRPRLADVARICRFGRLAVR